MYDHYSNTCDMIAATLDAILDSCTVLGYNITRDLLRIADDVNSDQLFSIPSSLPILVTPFWDNAIVDHYAIPGWDGSACSLPTHRQVRLARVRHRVIPRYGAHCL